MTVNLRYAFVFAPWEVKCTASESDTQTPVVPVPGCEGAWGQGLFDDVDGLVLWC